MAHIFFANCKTRAGILRWPAIVVRLWLFNEFLITNMHRSSRNEYKSYCTRVPEISASWVSELSYFYRQQNTSIDSFLVKFITNCYWSDFMSIVGCTFIPLQFSFQLSKPICLSSIWGQGGSARKLQTESEQQNCKPTGPGSVRWRFHRRKRPPAG